MKANTNKKTTYIYERTNWTDFTWNSEEILPVLSAVRLAQGKLLGVMNDIGFQPDNTILETMSLEVIKSSEIEGVKLDPTQVCSSVAKQLGIVFEEKIKVDKSIDGIVEVMLDATQNYSKALTKKRILGWQASPFPTGYSGINKIETGKYRTFEIDVVSGAVGHKQMHFKGVPAQEVNHEMSKFLKWINSNQSMDGLIKAAIAHLWFVTIHPFQDGNGRLARTITDMLLARDEKSKVRFYSMSNQMQKDRKNYYCRLESNQKGNGDITDWVLWFLGCLKDAIDDSKQIVGKTVAKANFWKQNKETVLNERQIKVLNRLLDGFEGSMTSSKWARITKTSTDTALRDINDLISKNILNKTGAGGRSTAYELVERS